MAYAAPTDTRARLYQGLMRRNRIVDILRWLVPGIGVAVLAILVGVMVLDTLGHRFGLSNIRIDRDNLVVETPSLTSTTSDGTVYAVMANEARVSASASDIIDMQQATLTMTPPKGASMKADAGEARLQTSNQLLDIPGVAHITSTDGLDGTLEGVFADLKKWTMVANGKVDIRMPDGSTIVSNGMTYDRSQGLYTFKDATVTLVSTPGEKTQ